MTIMVVDGLNKKIRGKTMMGKKWVVVVMVEG